MSKRFLVILVFLIAVIIAGLLTIFMITTMPTSSDISGTAIIFPTSPLVDTAISATRTAKSWTATPAPR